MNNIGKKVLKFTLISFISLIGLLIIVILLAGSPIGEKIIKNIVEDKLSTVLNMSVTIEKLKTNVFSNITTTDLEIQDPGSKMSDLRVNDLQIGYNIFALLSNKVSISEITIDGLHAQLIRDEQGRLLIPELPSKAEPSKHPMAVSIGEIVLSNSSLSFNDNSIPLEATIQNFSAGMLNTQDEQYTLYAQFNNAEIMYEGKDLTLQAFNISGTLAQDEVTIDEFSFGVMGIELYGYASANLDEATQSFTGEVSIDGDPNELIDLFDNELPMRYRPEIMDLNATIGFSGNIESPNITAKLKIPKIIAQEMELTDSNLDVHIANDSVYIDTLTTHLFDGYFSARGYIELDSLQQFNLQNSLTNINIIPLWDYLYTTPCPYGGSMNGSLIAAGSLTDIFDASITGTINSERFTYKNTDISELHTTFFYQKEHGTFELTQGTSKIYVNFSALDSILSGNTIIDIKEIEYLAGLLNVQGLTGQLHAEADFSGLPSKPLVNAKLEGKNIVYMGFPVDTLFADISYKDSVIRIINAEASGQTNSLSNVARALLATELDGSLKYNVSVQGALDDFSGNVTLEADDVTYENRYFKHISLAGKAINHTIDLERFLVEAEDIRCSGTASFDQQSSRGNAILKLEKKTGIAYTKMGNLAADFTLKPMLEIDGSLEKIDIALAQAVVDSFPNLQGLLSGSVYFKGSPQNPNATIDLKIDKPYFENLAFDNIILSADVTPSEIILKKANVGIKKSELRARARIGLVHTGKGFTISEESPISGEITFDNILAENFSEFFPQEVIVKGALSAHANIDGNLSKPLINGSISLMNGFLQTGNDKPSLTNLNATIMFDQDSLHIQDLSCNFNQKIITLTGYVVQKKYQQFSVDFALQVNNFKTMQIVGTLSKDMIDSEVNVNDFDISFIAALLPGLHYSKGLVDASLILKGKSTNPSIQGYIQGKNLEFLPNAFPKAFTKGNVDIIFDTESLNIHTLSFAMGEGSISCDGYAKYSSENIEDLKLNLSIKNISLQQKKVYLFTIKNANLQYYKSGGNYVVDGSVVLGETRYQQNVQIPKVLESLGRPKIFRKPTPLMTQTKLNVQITNDDDLWVDNNIARIKMKLALNVIGTLANPNLGGRIELVNGYIIYLDRKFELTRGVLDFINPNAINPMLDIQATAKVKNYSQPENPPYLVTITVTGYADDAKINLQSVPALDQANIISMLTFGTTREQLFSQDPDNYQTSLKDILLERAKLYSSQKIAGYVSGKLTDLLGLDDVSIEGNIFDLNNGGPQITASKKLSDRVKVTYSTKVGYLNEQSIKLDYKLTDHFYLQGQADQRGTAGIDAIYRIHFK